MRRLSRLLPFLLAAVAAACAESGTLEPRPDAILASSARGAKQITVMTRNMYIGADVDPVLQALVGGGDVMGALQTALAQLQRTDFPTRIRGIADEIARNRPYVIGLQEAYNLDVIPAYLGLPGAPIHLDFPGALQAALAARGLNYVVAGMSTLTDATLGPPGSDLVAVHLVDHDMLLIDPAHVTALGPAFTNTFAYNLPLPPGAPIAVLRGYIVQPAMVEGIQTLLVNSHTESGSAAGLGMLRYAQAMELVAVIGSAPNAILMGDLNDIPGSPLYGALAGAGLTDVWAAMRPGVAGYSCCELPDLSNRLPTLNQRIDYVWTRGFAGPSGKPQGQITLTSDNPSGLLKGLFGSVWPSDHAGLVATLLLPASMLH